MTLSRMSSQTGNGHRGGLSSRGANPGSELEQLIGQGQERLRQIIPGGGQSTLIISALVVALLVGAWTSYYTVPSDSVAVVQRFGKYVKDVPDCAKSCSVSNVHAAPENERS